MTRLEVLEKLAGVYGDPRIIRKISTRKGQTIKKFLNPVKKFKPAGL